MKKFFTILQDLIVAFTKAVTTCGFIWNKVNVFLQIKGNINLFLLDHRKWVNKTKEGSRFLTSKNTRELDLMSWISFIVPVHVQATPVSFMELLNDWLVRHANTSKDLVPDVQSLGLFPAGYTNVTFTVKKPSSVAIVHLNPPGIGGMMANSVEPRCPARKGAEGQYRAKQVEFPPGVCNEHVPSAEAKMCSELHGNMQRLAEMTNPVLTYFTMASMSRQVTYCNTKYLHWRPHARRNMVPLDPDRFSVNQDAMIRLVGWAGNMTLSNAFLQGVLTS